MEQTAATVSAPVRAVLLLGKGIPPGTYVSAGTRVELWSNASCVRAGDARRSRRIADPFDFYARQSRVWRGELSRFPWCTGVVGDMNQAAWVEIRLG
ncbi:hypothetical protein GCM10023335_48730 [Streptomyces siamensis]|uniref:Uncharacterized protein n=1 Tax=Streptomyces siamensis TaxID=1274986 RepID=A0ABP9J5L6_9ACTN